VSSYILTKLTHYGNGHKEMSWCVSVPAAAEVDPCQPSAPFRGLPRRATGSYSEEYAEGSAERANRRARQAVRKRIIEHNLDHLVTLTTRDNLEDYREALCMVQTFVRLVREKIPGWKYVTVPERQERGAWHWHLGVAGWQKLDILREAWAEVCGGIKAGNVDVKAPGGKGSRYQWRSSRLAGYLLKYITKEITDRPNDMKGRHRYMSAHGMETWDVTHEAFPLGTEISEIVQFFMDESAGRISKIWTDERQGVGWITS
jgi:hypothetical protein